MQTNKHCKISLSSLTSCTIKSTINLFSPTVMSIFPQKILNAKDNPFTKFQKTRNQLFRKKIYYKNFLLSWCFIHQKNVKTYCLRRLVRFDLRNSNYIIFLTQIPFFWDKSELNDFNLMKNDPEIDRKMAICLFFKPKLIDPENVW